MNRPVLRLRLERVSYGAAMPALRDVALDVGAGEIVGVAGHVGSGKSTLALAAAGLLGRAVPAQVEGTIVHDSRHPSAAFVFDDPWAQLTGLGETVAQEVAVGPENLALDTAEIRTRVEKALAAADASHLARRSPTELSGGELQRVALASALALEAPLLVLDEPTAQLDPDAAQGFARLLRALADSGIGVLLVEQDLQLLRAVADRVLVLADGTPIATGDPIEILDRWPPVDDRLGAPGDVRARHDPPPRHRSGAAGDEVLAVEGLVAGYDDKEVLRGASVRIARGEVVAWLGPNGAGKTTLARTIMGLVRARAGRVSVLDIALDALPVHERARHVGLVFQNPSRQLFARTVIGEAMFGPRVLGTEAESLARQALDVVGLGGLHHAHPGDLSSQAQRRLAIAAAMAARPAVLLLDEPTAGQDAQGRTWIAAALALQRSRGGAAVITHDLDFARRVCDRADMVVDGTVRAAERADERP